MCVEVILDLADADVDVAAINEYEISKVQIVRHFDQCKKFACLRIVDVGNSVAKLRRHYQHGGIHRLWLDGDFKSRRNIPANNATNFSESLPRVKFNMAAA